MSKLDNLRKQVWGIRCTGSAKLAMLFMAEKTRAGVAKVKVQDVADACGISKTQAKAVLSKLREDGYLHVVGNDDGGNGQPRIYKITDIGGLEFRLPTGSGKPYPLYICIHKKLSAGQTNPGQGLVSANDSEINEALLAMGL